VEDDKKIVGCSFLRKRKNEKKKSFLSFVLIQKKQKIKKQQAVRAQNDFAPLIRE
jgi:hypothetical protein